jgi:hypothetical protein
MRIPLPRALALRAHPVLAFSVAGCAKRSANKDLPYVARDVGTLYSAASSGSTSISTSWPRPCSTRSSASIPIRSGRAARS